MRCYKQIDFKVMAWKNGGGSTTELFRISKQGNPNEFHFRLSMATVQTSGPFSQFTGIERLLMLLEGDGFILNEQGKEFRRLQKPFDYCLFQGEAQLQCELLGGSCVDFNVMTERNWGHSTIFSRKLHNNQKHSFHSEHQRFLFLYKTASELIELSANEEFTLEASENMTIIEIELRPIVHESGRTAKA